MKIETNKISKPIIKVAIALLIVICLLVLKSKSGTIYSFQQISGTNQIPISASFGNPLAYPSYTLIPGQVLTLTNCFTNESIYLAYGAQLTSTAGTNLVTLSGFVTNLTGANGWTVFPTNFSYTTPALGTNVNVTPWGIIGISSNGVPAPYPNGTNGANWQ